MELFCYRVYGFEPVTKTRHPLKELYGAKVMAVKIAHNLNRRLSSIIQSGGLKKDYKFERLIMMDNGATIPITGLLIYECTEGSNFRVSPWGARAEFISADDKYEIWKAEYPDSKGCSYFLVDINGRAK